MTDGSNTAGNSQRGAGKPFTKGDPRINRKGRPKTFDALRALAQQIGNEEAQVNGQPVIINGHKVTKTEAVLREWVCGDNPQLQRAFIEIAYGKVPDNLDITSKGGPIQIGVVGIDYRVAIAPLAPGPMADSFASSEDKSPGNGQAMG